MAEFSGRDETVVVAIEDLLHCEQLDHRYRSLEASAEASLEGLKGSNTNLESFSNFFFGVGVLHFASHHGQEL